MREAERSIIYNEYIEYQDDLMTGTVERQDDRFIYIDLGKVEAVLSQRDQIEGEQYNAHDRIKVYVSNVEDSTKGPQVFVSRTHPGLIKRLFEQEVPEIYDGTVEIMSVAREAGDRSKVAVTSRDGEVDAVGTCVGPKGARVQVIVDELNGENMDIVEWSEDPAVFIQNALNPAEVLDVRFDDIEQSCVVVVPDYQLSLAIGKRGQNVRLAAKLTGYKIDIKSDVEMEELEREALAESSEEVDKSAEESSEVLTDSIEDNSAETDTEVDEFFQALEANQVTAEEDEEELDFSETEEDEVSESLDDDSEAE